MEVWEQHGQFIIGMLSGVMLTLVVLLLMSACRVDPDEWQ